ncbi:MAG: diacylglycerol kinase [Treponema sp.]|jgi:diacylglycerol kinase family enzyme|nr:diacylglycerol kinase [Treponema sp.]
MSRSKAVVPDVFGELLGGICSHTPLAKERPLRWTVIANPTAGGFTIRSRWKRHAAFLEQCAALAAANPPHAGSAPSDAAGSRGLIPTAGAGHAGAVTRALIEEARSAPPAGLYLIITAGGDGTSLEVLTALYHAPQEIRENFVVLRLPMGTGNDGADGPELDRALKLLIDPAVITRQRALRLTTANPEKTGFLAFNILSVGLDAFVTHMTNKMKGRLPGDSYKLWVDIASLLYDRLYKVGPMEVRALDPEGRVVEAFREKVLLLAVGESGRRTYGSHKRILPDSRNVCMVRQMPLLRKVALKGLFTTGEHVSKPESLLFNASRVELKGENPILAQMDGETVLLRPEDFPAVIELTEPVIPILRTKLTP